MKMPYTENKEKISKATKEKTQIIRKRIIIKTTEFSSPTKDTRGQHGNNSKALRGK